jgi:L-iditol 2-dehydrogenase
MKAALKTADGRFQIADVEEPSLPGAEWVKVRIHVAGICGTDLRHWQKHDEQLECHIMGHELAGVVAEVGKGVTNVAPGDRVVVETVMGDGQCEYCRVQRYNICPHLYDVRTQYVSRAYAEYLIGPASKILKLPDHISLEEARSSTPFRSRCTPSSSRASRSTIAGGDRRRPDRARAASARQARRRRRGARRHR